jgi:hypothetical protein
MFMQAFPFTYERLIWFIRDKITRKKSEIKLAVVFNYFDEGEAKRKEEIVMKSKLKSNINDY